MQTRLLIVGTSHALARSVGVYVFFQIEELFSNGTSNVRHGPFCGDTLPNSIKTTAQTIRITMYTVTTSAVNYRGRFRLFYKSTAGEDGSNTERSSGEEGNSRICNTTSWVFFHSKAIYQ